MSGRRSFIVTGLVIAASPLLGGCDATIDAAFEEAVEGALERTTTDEAVAQSEVIDITPEQLRASLDQGQIRLIDVRRDDEVAEGIIPGAEHIMLDDFDPAALDLSDGREVVLYCRSGRRSGIAAQRLAAHTGEPARHLAGGILAWQEAGLELEIAAAD